MGAIKKYATKTIEIVKSKQFLLSIFTVIIVGILVHAYRFFRLDLNYDYLAEYYASDGNVIRHRIELGRFLSPVFYVLMGRINAPWIIAFFAFPFIGISTYLVSIFFNRQKPIEVIIIGCLLTVNLTLTVLISTFLHDFHTDMLALLFSVSAACVWKKASKVYHYFLLVPFLVLSMGLYQSYSAVCFTLIFIYTMLSFIKNGLNKKDFLKLIFGFLSVLISMLFYFGIANLVCFITNIPMESRVNVFDVLAINPLTNLFCTYRDWFATLLVYDTSFGKTFNLILSISISIPFLMALIVFLLDKNNKGITKIVVLIMLILFPFATNYTEFLSGSYYSLVMFYPTTAFTLLFCYLFIATTITLNSTVSPKHLVFVKRFFLIFLLIHIYCSAITSNIVYAKKETEASSTFAYMNRVVYAIETYDGYKAGETPVAIFGAHKIIGLQEGYENLSYITGARTQSSLGSTYQCYTKAYFEYIMKTNINVVDDSILKEFGKMEEIINLPIFPDKNSLKYLDGVLIVKLENRFF